MGLFDFFKKKREPISTTLEPIYEPVSQRNPSEIRCYEMKSSKASCLGISTTTSPRKTYEESKPKHLKFTNLTLDFLKKNV